MKIRTIAAAALVTSVAAVGTALPAAADTTRGKCTATSRTPTQWTAYAHTTGVYWTRHGWKVRVPSTSVDLTDHKDDETYYVVHMFNTAGRQLYRRTIGWRKSGVSINVPDPYIRSSTHHPAYVRWTMTQSLAAGSSYCQIRLPLPWQGER